MQLYELIEFSLLDTVAIMDIVPGEVLVGHELGRKKYLESLSKKQKADQAGNTRVTRRQADDEAKTRKDEERLSSDSRAMPVNLHTYVELIFFLKIF